MAHDDYYHKVQKKGTERLARVSHAVHDAEDCHDLYEQLAHVVGHRAATAISGYVDAIMSHHELNENK